MDLGIEGRVALVMGASKGLGRAIAASLAREGARVAVASRSRERIEEAGTAIAADMGGELRPFAADTGDVDRLPEVAAAVADQLGPIDILVTNTGGPPPGDS